jgi:hypothetical protein
MTSTAVILVVLFLIVGTYLGWHSNRAYAAHGDIKATKRGRLPGFRRTRMRSGLIALATFIILIFALAALLH